MLATVVWRRGPSSGHQGSKAVVVWVGGCRQWKSPQFGWGMKLVFPVPQVWGRMATPLMKCAASARVAGRSGQNCLVSHPLTIWKSVSQVMLSA